MTNIASLDSFFARIGPLASQDFAQRQRRLAEEAPEFSALSFFHSREVMVSKILAYLLNPYAKHGQRLIFLRAFLEVLGVKVGILQSVVVQSEALCFTLRDRRRLDIQIRFTSDSIDHVIVIESKSHFAGDQPGQVRDYLSHLRSAYPHSRHSLYYLNNGKRPKDRSISEPEWNEASSLGLCRARSFCEVMSEWVKLCKSKVACRLEYFLDDFLAFAGFNGGSPMPDGDTVQKELTRIIEESASAPSGGSSELDALLAVYALHEVIWRCSIRQCLDNVKAVLDEQLSEWDSKVETYFNKGESYCELQLWKKDSWTMTSDGEANLRVLLVTDGSRTREDQQRICRTARFVVVIQKHKEFNFGKTPFNQDHKLVIGPGKDQFWQDVVLNGLEDIWSAECIRYMLTSQGVAELAQQLQNFVKAHENEMNACFNDGRR